MYRKKLVSRVPFVWDTIGQVNLEPTKKRLYRAIAIKRRGYSRTASAFFLTVFPS